MFVWILSSVIEKSGSKWSEAGHIPDKVTNYLTTCILWRTARFRPWGSPVYGCLVAEVFVPQPADLDHGCPSFLLPENAD